MRDDYLDELIDATARAMSAGEPPPLMRQRTRDRIETRSDFRNQARSRWPLAGAAGAVAAAAVWVALARPAPPPGPEAPPAAAAATQPAGPAAAAAAGEGSAVAPVRAVAAARRDRVPAAAREPVEASDLLSAPSPIVVGTVSIGLLPELDPDAPVPLDVPLLEVPMPLQAERLEIEPLTFE
jgi:hypothetical protein